MTTLNYWLLSKADQDARHVDVHDTAMANQEATLSKIKSSESWLRYFGMIWDVG